MDTDRSTVFLRPVTLSDFTIRKDAMGTLSRSWGKILVLSVLALLLAPLGWGLADDGPADSLPATPVDEQAWEQFEELLPSGESTEYTELPWRPTVLEALEEAQKQDRPLLLWQMRGHPLGFT